MIGISEQRLRELIDALKPNPKDRENFAFYKEVCDALEELRRWKQAVSVTIAKK